MDENVNLNKQDVMIMKLLHYFITEKNYNPVILQGAQNEIWLENLNSSYKIVRIVSEYIHNNEQLKADLYKANQVGKTIKRKTFNLSMNILSIFTDWGENVSLTSDFKNISCVSLKADSDLKKYDFITTAFPDINEKLTFNEEGIDLFLKITGDINEHNKKEAVRVEKLFLKKRPYVTIALIFINVLVFLIGIFFNKQDSIVNLFSVYGPYIKMGEFYRLLTGAFVHVDMFHLLFNMYALYVLGEQIEKFYGSLKYAILYLVSAITGNLLSILLNTNAVSIGASGAIFGVMGAIVYFGYNYRIYFGNTIVKQIVPIILVNLLIGFSFSGIDNWAHIGGLVGGLILSSALGINDSKKDDSRVNGAILSFIYICFLIYMNFFNK